MKIVTKLFLLLALSGISFAGWDCEKVEGVSLTWDVYWASVPPELRIFSKPDTPASPKSARIAKALDLAIQGFKVDIPIHVDFQDPVCTMLIRRNQGFVWVPSALDPPIFVMPGLKFPGLPSYDPDRPSLNYIKVSVRAEDYKPFDAPPPLPSTAPKVGFCYVITTGEVCAPGLGLNLATVKDGEEIQENGRRFRAVITRGLIGTTVVLRPF